ncbi:protein phosphatase [Clostridia bacterium]|nr:protein phosphatase [Clostridia bacterium]
MGFTATGITDKGLVRENNEDAIFVSQEKIGRLNNVFIIADGMGGHTSGEIASSKAVEFFLEYVRKSVSDGSYTENFLAGAVKYANDRILGLTFSDQSLRGMGTTFTAACTDNVNFYYAHVGDSRAYSIANGEITQITQDHTFVGEMRRSGALTEEELKTHPNRHMLTRALGTDYETTVDYGYRPLAGGDIFLLCSDGLTNMLTDEEIKAIAEADGTLDEKAQKLVATAIEAGGKDNVSVIIIS